MPYIDNDDRTQYIPLIKEISKLVPNDHTKRSGHMNFIISRLIKDVYGYEPGKYLKYWQWNEIKGFLSCITEEIGRRYIAPYEDQKIKENGDI
jgi:hypothetical protein